MVSKNLRTVIGVMIALFLVYGCLGSGSENDNQVKTVEAPAVQAPAVQAPAVQAPAVQAPVDQGQKWLCASRNWYLVLGQDMEDLSAAASAGDLDSMYKYAKQIKGNINNAKKSDLEYSVSSEYSYAHTEYLNSLEDMGNAMDLIISCGDGGWTESQKITEATELMKKGNVHITNFSNAVKTA